MEIFAHQLRVGDVVDGEPIYSISNHPSGLAFFDVFGELIITKKPNDIVVFDAW